MVTVEREKASVVSFLWLDIQCLFWVLMSLNSQLTVSSVSLLTLLHPQTKELSFVPWYSLCHFVLWTNRLSLSHEMYVRYTNESLCILWFHKETKYCERNKHFVDGTLSVTLVMLMLLSVRSISRMGIENQERPFFRIPSRREDTQLKCLCWDNNTIDYDRHRTRVTIGSWEVLDICSFSCLRIKRMIKNKSEGRWEVHRVGFMSTDILQIWIHIPRATTKRDKKRSIETSSSCVTKEVLRKNECPFYWAGRFCKDLPLS
jgi:hypothetical protein